MSSAESLVWIRLTRLWVDSRITQADFRHITDTQRPIDDRLADARSVIAQAEEAQGLEAALAGLDFLRAE
jgi:hypothetical protein